MRKICLAVLMVLCMIPVALATQTRVNGDISLAWTNAYDRPQQFAGPITGGLVGSIALTSNTDYDAAATSVGTTWSDNVILTLEGVGCEGFYGGSNVNQGRNVGTFVLSCDNGNMIEGVMHGVNDETGNIQAHYNAFIITPTPGPVGEPGPKGLDGLNGADGAQGPQGEKGDKGDKGEQGLQGIPGEKCDKGDTGAQGEQGIPGPQGEQGVKGDQGDTANVDALQKILDASRYYSTFKPFWTWYDAGICEVGTTTCAGTKSVTCVNAKWNTGTTCQFGCNNSIGTCIVQPKEDCTVKANVFLRCQNYNGIKYGYLINKDYYTCTTGQGTPTACNIGQCKGKDVWSYCANGCDVITQACKV